MIKNREQFKASFLPYLREFIRRASEPNPTLKQVAVADELSSKCAANNISLTTSFGMGEAAAIPWLACFLPEQTASAKGVYPVILFNRSTRTLSVCYGVSASAKTEEGDWKEKWPRDWPLSVISGLNHFQSGKYKKSFELKSFEGSNLEDFEAITEAFFTVVDNYLAAPRKKTPNLESFMVASKDLTTLIGIAVRDLPAAGLQLADGLLGRLAASLLTKRFLILTGLAGSGKTKLAHAFAAWIAESDTQYRVVAVGADWTTNENLLGYQDALRPEIYRKPNNGALDLILRARDDAARPYFLILDEMNLSHVERYFADMLSAIESGEPIALHTATDELPGGDGDTLPVPPRLTLPKNLFIVGTVNVDETTYMFSPKVLDRANVIEFRATADQINAFMDDPQPIRMAALAHKGAGYGAAFVAVAAGDAPRLADLPKTIHPDGAQCTADLKARLVEAFQALEPIGAEFGFRTAFEISRFVAFHATLTGAGWQFSDALDAQVYQKLMPKLHGSERRLGPVLKALEGFCTTHGCPMSLVKIRRMQDRLRDGFTSFAEA
jgi:5-methylcytosine-specific restriction protein B